MGVILCQQERKEKLQKEEKENKLTGGAFCDDARNYTYGIYR